MRNLWYRIWHWGWHGSEWPGVYFGSPICPQCQAWAKERGVSL